VIKDARQSLALDYDRIRSGGLVYAGGTTAERFFGERLFVSATLSAVENTYERLTYTPSTRDTGFVNNSAEQEQTLAARAEYTLEGGAKIAAGAFGRRCDFDIDISEESDTLKRYTVTAPGDTTVEVVYAGGDPVTRGLPQSAHAVAAKCGGYVSGIVPIAKRLRVIPGVRVDGFSYTGEMSVSPRLSLHCALAPGLDLTGAFGIQFQDPLYADLIRHDGNRDLPAKRSVSGVAGVEYVIAPLGVKLVSEGFYKHYSRIPVDRALLDVDEQYRFLLSGEYSSGGEGRSAEETDQGILVQRRLFAVALRVAPSAGRGGRVVSGRL
jgi:hypothetical protein